MMWRVILGTAGLAMVCSWSTAQAPASTSEAPAQPETLDVQIARLVAQPAVARDHWGVVVTTLDGKPIYSLNEAQLFQPASNAKLFTTAAAMALLGPDCKFTTRVEYGSAGTSDKTVDGDVVIVGAGDGSFNDRELPYRTAFEARNSPQAAVTPLRYLAEFADKIAAAGVKRVTGNIVGDDTVFPWEPYPQDWSIDDMVWGYGAPVSGLSIDDNQIKVTVRPGKTAVDKPIFEWPLGIPAFYRVDAGGLVSGPAKSGNHVQMERAAGSKVLRVYGSIGVDAAADTEEIAISDPAEFAAIALKGLLEDRGVRVDGTAEARHRLVAQGPGFLEESREPLSKLPAASPLSIGAHCFEVCPIILQHTSPPLTEDVVLTNKVSQNLHAELLLHHLGKLYGQSYTGGEGGVDGSTAEGVRVVRQFLLDAGIDKDDFVFFDGSGLSEHDLVTPRAVVRLLQFAATQPWFAAWKASLPVGGEDGSLETRFPKAPLKDHVFAKTGTLGEARALSGYLDCASGRSVIFSVLVGNHLPGNTADRDAMDTIVAAIAAAE